VGESEAAVRRVFQRARSSSPCIIFFDELDALCPKRENDSSSRNSQRLVNQLLTEMDGFDDASEKQVFVIAATNRPDIIDPAMLRPGRLDKLVYVDIPSVAARAEILQTHTRKLSLAADVDLEALARDPRCDGFTGADLNALVREAGTFALRRLVAKAKWDAANGGGLGVGARLAAQPPSLTKDDFYSAFGKCFASVSARDLKRYRGMQKRLRGSRAVIKEEDEADADGFDPDPVGGAATAGTSGATADPGQ
jgi:ribosome biogenesis ATPase